MAVINTDVRQHLQRLAVGVFNTAVLPLARRYVSWVPLEFLQLLLAGEGGEGGDQQGARGQEGAGPGRRSDRREAARQAALQEWRLRLTYYM